MEIPIDWKWVKLEDLANKISLNKIKIKQKDYLLLIVFHIMNIQVFRCYIKYTTVTTVY